MGGSRAAAAEIEIAGHTVRLSSPDRVIFPQRGFTKADVFHY
jgi:DNA primase